MPLNTVMPMDWRAAAPAPLATTRGTTPRMNANEVMRIGRKRRREPSSAASIIPSPSRRSFLRDLDDENSVLGRERNQKHETNLNIDIVRTSEHGQR